MEDNKVFITNDKGEKIEGEVLFTFEANGDDFVIYSIKDTAYAGKVDEEGNIKAVEEDEWKLVEKVFNEFMEEENGDQ